MQNKEILVTLGPSSLNEKVIKQLSSQNVNLFRINLSHTPVEEIESTISTIKKHTSVPICLDSEGAQIRNQYVSNDQVSFKKGEHVKISYSTIIGDKNNISFSPKHVVDELKTGTIIKIDFNAVCLKVVDKTDEYCLAEVITGGKVGSNKAVDVEQDIDLEPITEKDKIAIEIGKKMGVKNYALSFASCKRDVQVMRNLIGSDAKLISKIESKKGLINLNEILEATDAILIDRGDLSRQVTIEKIPFLQRRIIAIAKYKKVPVYVATNLLESMIENHAPTRAEVNDVISTLLMGSDGLVLAAETAIGKYPLETIEVVNKLIDQFERWTPYTNIDEIIGE
jgi:pyruvate kinase